MTALLNVYALYLNIGLAAAPTVSKTDPVNVTISIALREASAKLAGSLEGTF